MVAVPAPRDDDAERAQHEADLLAFQHEASKALLAALHRPLTQREVDAIGWWAGLPSTPPRPIPHLRTPQADGDPF